MPRQYHSKAPLDRVLRMYEQGFTVNEIAAHFDVDPSTIRHKLNDHGIYPGRERKAPYWLYRRCANAKQRCTNPNYDRYYDYGGRGIEFRFESINAMALYLYNLPGYSQQHTIDRIDNDGHYEPGNLRWVNAATQRSNRRCTVDVVTVMKIRRMYKQGYDVTYICTKLDVSIGTVYNYVDKRRR